MSGFVDRMVRAAKLDASLYEEVEADESALAQAMGVVALHSIAAGIGSAKLGGFSGAIGGILVAFVGWFLWSYITYLVGTKLLPESQTQASYGQLLRCLGFAAAPGLLLVLGFIPLLGWLVDVLVFFWLLAAMVVAIRQALDYSGTGRAVAVALLGWIPYVVLRGLMYFLLGIPTS
jgi:hypothetical protein